MRKFLFCIFAIALVVFASKYSINQSVDYINEDFSSQESLQDTQLEPTVTPEPTVEPTTEPTPEPTIEPVEIELPWYLLLVNYENPLDQSYTFEQKSLGSKVVDARIYDSLNQMIVDAKAEGLTIWVASAYRSYETQENVLSKAVKNRMSDYNMTYDEAYEHALNSIAMPGYSEHQTGLCVDLNTVSRSFEYTDEYEWLQENAAKYGFVQRYYEEKQDITNITAEVWHYRYVGSTAALYMVENNLCLEEYIELYLSGEI